MTVAERLGAALEGRYSIEGEEHCPFFESLNGLPRFDPVAQESTRCMREFDVEGVPA